MATIARPAERADWLRVRHSYFNASAAGALYGVHPHINLADVVADKLAPGPTDNGRTEAMERGERLEPVLLEWFGDRHGVRIARPDVLHVNGRLMATLDGEPVGDAMWWVEAKTTSQSWDAVPDHVYWQVVAQSAASGRHECWVVWFDSDLRLKQAKVTVPAEHVADVLARAEQFMAFIDLGMSPEGVELSADHLAQMFPKPEAGKWAELDLDDVYVVKKWEEARNHRIAAEKREKALRTQVARLVTDAEGAKHKGIPFVIWRQNRPSRKVDWKALAKRHPRAVARYERDFPGARVLRATKELRTFFGGDGDG